MGHSPLGRVHRAGWIAGLLLLCACVAHGAQVEIGFRHPAPPPSSSPIELTLRSHSPGKEPLRVVASGEGSQALELDEGAWTLEVKAPGLWAPPIKFVASANDVRRLQVDLFEATVVQGRVEGEKGEKPPAEIAIELYPPIDNGAPGDPPRPRRGRDLQALAFRCPVQEGSFECPAPVGSWDVRIGAADRVGHYFWRVPFPKGSPAVFKPIRLQRGASVVGWVRVEGPMKKDGSVQLKLTPFQAASSQTAESTNRALALTTNADARGFFQLTGAAPGAYILTATLEGFGPARFFPLRIFADRESQLEELLVLRPPISLEVGVNPPVDLKGRPWNLEIFDLGTTPGAMESVAEGATGADGHWRSPALSEGSFRLQLSDPDQKVWEVQEVELGEASSKVDFDLDFVEVEGELSMRGEPLVATLYFGGRMGVPSLRFDSDVEGRFAGSLPRQGPWRIEIHSKDPLIRRSLPRFEVRRPPGKNVARVAIDLPGGKLRGRTVNEQGQAVAGAMVLIEVAGEPPVFFETAENGEFEAHGLGKGQVFVEASTRELQADALWVDLDPEAAVPPLELVLRKTQEVRGWVLGPFGGVPGAHVIATALAGNQSQAVTDLTGRFSLKAPAGASTFDVIVLPPGYSLLARRVSLGENREIRLFVEPEGGALILKGLDDPEAQASALLLYHEGVPIYVLSTLRRWSEGNGQRWVGAGPRVAPQLQAGEYHVCRVPAGPIHGVPRASGPCVGGLLLPGGELTLQVPGP